MSGVPAGGAPTPIEVRIACPEWVAGAVDWDRPLTSDEEKVRLTIRLARENV